MMNDTKSVWIDVHISPVVGDPFRHYSSCFLN